MQSSSINLVKRQTTSLDDLIKWALSIGRLLVIIVEIVAFSSFLYRFYLDRKINDLNTEIKGKQAIVASLADREKEYRNIQGRIALASDLDLKADKNILILNDVVQSTPSDITFNTFSLEGNIVSIEAIAGSSSTLSLFMNTLRDHPQVSTATIARIENTGQGNPINVFITIRLGEEEK